jgi:hypothetical protein
MACREKEIQELLPAFSGRSLDPTAMERVEGHLALCAECREELVVLRMLVDDVVPDPGGAFWATMPDRVFQQVQAEQARKRASGFGWQRLVPAVPRWAWASSATVLVAVIAWFSFHPAATIQQPVNDTEQVALDDANSDEQIEVAELTSPELSAVTQWADNAYTPINEAVDEELTDRTEQDLSDELGNLSAPELDRLLNVLKKKEQDARDKARKSSSEKGIG